MLAAERLSEFDVEIDQMFPDGVRLRLLPGHLTDIKNNAPDLYTTLQHASTVHEGVTGEPFIKQTRGVDSLDTPVTSIISLLHTASAEDKVAFAKTITQELRQQTIPDTLELYEGALFDGVTPPAIVQEMRTMAHQTVENFAAAHLITQKVPMKLDVAHIPTGSQLLKDAQSLRFLNYIAEMANRLPKLAQTPGKLTTPARRG